MCCRACDPLLLLNTGTGRALWLLSKGTSKSGYVCTHMLRIAIKPPNERSMRPSTGTHKVHREAGGAGSLPGKWESERGRSLAVQLDPIKAPQLLTRSLSSLSAEESPARAAESGQFASRVSRPCPSLIVPRETFGEHVPAKFHTTKSRHPAKSPADFFFFNSH